MKPKKWMITTGACCLFIVVLELVYGVLAAYKIITVTPLIQLIATIIIYSNTAVGIFTAICYFVTAYLSSTRRK